MAKLTKEEIISTLKEMTLLEVNDLVKAIETEKFYCIIQCKVK